ncbi:MAG: hypothetical protein HWQ43_05680 [Nostoc sp. JL31]|uniref:hypothetical protein n=1 Tax=Nostoc sp. JL31 TaxID=2815395 RepID=UPI0025DF77AA|nr:hypothetical protein [Nostoc sp. JL31]MBN3888669.1 hypothetical protein [Nostoc sp. JL31]
METERYKNLSGSLLCRQLIASGLSVGVATSICRKLVSSGLVIASVSGFSQAAIADSTATIHLTGTVPLILDISSNTVLVKVPLNGLDINNAIISSLAIRSNSADGYTVMVKSVNNGLLKLNINNVVYSVPYTFRYNGASAISLSTTEMVVEHQNSKSSDVLACAISTGCYRYLSINVNGSDASTTPTGVYTDTLIFEIIDH